MPFETPTQTIKGSRVFFLASLIAVLTFLVYAPALSNGFVGMWDDQKYVLENEYIRSMGPGFFKWVFTSAYYLNWHPLTIISYAIDYKLWGLDPFGYHLVNNVFHALNTFLVFLLSVRLVQASRAGLSSKGTLFAGAAASLLFGLHPMHVESVAWVSERKDVLSFFFYALSILAYLRYRSSGAIKSYILSLLIFALALMSKPMAVSLPIALLILDFFPLKREGELKKALIEKAPFIALSALSAIITIRAQMEGGAVVDLVTLTFPQRVIQAAHGYVFYLYKLALPLNLSPYYPALPRLARLNISLLVPLSVILAITAFCLYKLRRNRAYLAVWAFFIFSLLPAIGLIQVGGQAAADRYIYLPSAGPMLLAGFGAGLILERLSGRAAARAYPFVLASVIALLSWSTVTQTFFWKDALTLWTRAIELYPDNAGLAYYNRAAVFFDQGRYEAAAADYTKAIQIKPDNYRSYNYRGLAYDMLGRRREAIDDFSAAVRLKPDFFEGYYNRSLVHFKTGDSAQAISDLTDTIDIKPDFESAYTSRGIIYSRLGDIDAAVRDFEAALEVNPASSKAHMNLSMLYSKLGDGERAEYHLKRSGGL